METRSSFRAVGLRNPQYLVRFVSAILASLIAVGFVFAYSAAKFSTFACEMEHANLVHGPFHNLPIFARIFLGSQAGCYLMPVGVTIQGILWRDQEQRLVKLNRWAWYAAWLWPLMGILALGSLP
jgi:hypothetical protein